ncbi:MAG: hypothetical protein U0359_02210 [Byssovorax sp.]
MGSRRFIPGILLALAACNHVGDQICEEGTDPNNHDDQCPYGPPGGPKVTEDGCPDIPQMPGPACTLSWRDDIWPALTTGAAESDIPSCALLGCHGPKTVLKLPEDPEQSYQTLKGYVGQQNYPYLSDKAPGHTWILCNLHGDKGGGQPMPQGTRLPDALYEKVVAWAQCGEPLDKPAGGAGGTGGGGGSP